MVLQLTQSKLLQALQNAGGVSGTGGGGWLQKLLGIGLGALGAGLGGLGGGGGIGSAIHEVGHSTGGDFGIGGGIPGFAGRFAAGGGFMVGGDGGIDTSWVGFKATKGERVTIQTPAQQTQDSNGVIVHNHYHTWNVVTQDARSFMSEDTQRQLTQRANRIMQRAALIG